MNYESQDEVITKPTMEQYGYYEQDGFDGDRAGWCIQGGEDAYYEALKKWEIINNHISNNKK